MSFSLNCLESLTAISFGLYAVTTGDLGTMAGGTVAGTTLLRLWSEHRSKRPLDSERALTKAREAVAKDFAVWSEREGVSAADIRAADLAMKQYLADCIPDKETLGGLVISDQRYPKSAARHVVDKLAKRDPLFHPEGVPRDFALTVVESALRSALGDEEYIRELQVYMLTAIGQALHRVGQGVDLANQKLDALLAALGGKAAEQNIHEETLIALARKIASKVDDVETAKRELERAINLFLEIQDRAAQGSNLGDLIDETMRRIAALNEQGNFAEGAAEAESAYDTIQARKDELNAAELRAIQAAIDQHKLAFDAPSVALWIERRIKAQTGTISAAALFDEIEPLRDLALVRGLWFEAEIALDLVRRAVELATPGWEMGVAQNWLGVVASDTGERLGGAAGVALLEEAVTAYRAALRVRAEAGLLADWAGTQNNLGLALATQGGRLGGAAGMSKLEEAVTAFCAALQVQTEADLPTEWAMTQNNLGGVLQTQVERLGGVAGVSKLEGAVTAFRAALSVYTEADFPADWAMTQNNLGLALTAKGMRLGGVAGVTKLEEAVAAFCAALRVYIEADFPTDWAAAQNNLGNALAAHGERLSGAAGLASLEAAVTAYRAALCVRTEADLPADWAGTQHNLGNALGTLGARLGGAAGVSKLEEAVTAHRAALRVYSEEDMPANWAMTRGSMAFAFVDLADAEPHRAVVHLLEAEAAVLDALRVFTPADMPYDYGTATELLTQIRTRLASLSD